jgi:hypothetical protein
MCYRCKHIHTDAPDEVVTEACDAFPKGIPDEIFWGAFDHTQPFEGDNGIRFEEID